MAERRLLVRTPLQRLQARVKVDGEAPGRRVCDVPRAVAAARPDRRP
ncbi:hypothetical protein [Actinoallomurus iriomotensis]|nr:hypothetical protein [Actinoallomurus iriomotensis]